MGLAVAYLPKKATFPLLTLPPLQGPSAVCVFLAVLQRQSPNAAVVRLDYLHRAAEVLVLDLAVAYDSFTHSLEMRR